MAWWKRKSRTSVSEIETGMTAEQVNGLLGVPQERVTEEEFQKGRMMHGGRSLLGNEYWYYDNIPRRGWTTMVTLRKGLVVGVTQGPTPLATRRSTASGTLERPGSVGLGRFGGTAAVMRHPESQVLGTRVVDDVV
jgi:hypothetical protein